MKRRRREFYKYFGGLRVCVCVSQEISRPIVQQLGRPIVGHLRRGPVGVNTMTSNEPKACKYVFAVAVSCEVRKKKIP